MMWDNLLLASPVLLAVLYPLAVQYERGGLWRILLPLYVGAGLCSAIANNTVAIVLLWDLPRKGEVTLSQRLERLVFDTGWRGKIARTIARYTNLFDPTGAHITLP